MSTDAEPSTLETPRRPGLPAERVVFFTDAVVAIAMTLLVLPLMESVSEASAKGLTVAEWVDDHDGQLVSFALSFVIVSSFWISHHRLWDGVERLTGAMLILNTLWLLAIVWLPVGTALLGGIEPDRAQAVIYIGPMILAAVCMALVALELIRRPALMASGHSDPRGGMRAWVVLSVIYTVALVAALIRPGEGYYALFALGLVGPITAAWRRRDERAAARRRASA